MAIAAYAALLAVARSLREILDLEEHIDPLHKEKVVSLHEKVDFVVTFLEDHSDKYHQRLGHMRNQIREAAYGAQDFMDSYYCAAFTGNYGSSSRTIAKKMNLDRDLTMVFERIDFIWEKMMKMNNGDTAPDLRSVSFSSPVDRSSTGKKMLVGLDDDLIAIKERVYEDSGKLQIIPIVGMGGIGKTALARRAYDDSSVTQHFDIYAWITVSAEYQRGETIAGLLHQLEKRDSEQYHRRSDAELVTLIYQNLKGRRYLIVIDDIWSVEAWDDLKMIFPDDGNGSKILLTTRILDVAAYLGASDTPVHQMKCLNEDQSWKLLQEKVFGQQSCPLQLVEVGKNIAKNCGGLPLTIVVVAGLLLSMGGGIMNEEVWGNVAENISSREPTIALQCSKILLISYDRLPLRLKPCFLYIAAFPEDSDINVSKLIKLWVAEGFLKPNDQSKCLEDVGERYLEDLVRRSLLLVSKKGRDGKLKTVGIHDMLRELCTTIAEEERFFCVASKTKFRTEILKNLYRRLTVLYSTETNVRRLKIQDSSVRSILLHNHTFVPNLHLQSRHVYILDAPRVTWSKFSAVISKFDNLRYFAFALDDDTCPHGMPKSISKHPNLETIDVHARFSSKDSIQMSVPYEILKMRKLRHLIYNHMPFRFSPYPSDIGIVRKSDLQTIGEVMDFVFTEEIIKILVNLKKLEVAYNMENRSWADFNIDILFRLQNLEVLKISVDYQKPFDLSMAWNAAFPIGLKKLTLDEVFILWEHMTLIGSLPNLEILDLTGALLTKQPYSEWRTVEGQFLLLKYFRSSLDYLTEWVTEKEHFPCLETLILQNVLGLTEIPIGIGEIDTLQYIELGYCRKSVVDSAKQIQRLQHENGNDAFRVRVIDMDGYNVLF